ncbi:hypothetical protein BDV96DRAFT_505148 [Lophiotrema nucula]|uniref:FAD/NAD(P)-binding domain-containing protein n=1 Tax=Lophiotrema nucula TaxID=690887 RepID=A0A6A5YM40_9PLEO|nr:hypothetical protein BDV96DRAFT_505148 [Lophiotrema nucula]
MEGKQKNIVVVGASFAGILQSHCIMKHVIPKFPSHHLVLINPSPDFFWVVGAPRAAIDDKMVPDEKVFLKIADGFKQYSSDRYTLITGTATGIDTEQRIVQYRTEKGIEEVPYHALLLATGGKTPSPLFSPFPSTEQTREAMRVFREALPQARSIVIGGGGACAVEIGGEIGDFLNTAARRFAATPTNLKAKITLVTKGTKLLPTLSTAAATQAEKYLNRVGANVVYGRKVIETVPQNAGRTIETLVAIKGEKVKIHLDDGEVLEADIFIPAFHGKPSTSYVPQHLLTDTNHIKTNPSTLRVDDAGPRVFAIGECSSAFGGASMHIVDQTKVITTNLKRDLRAFVDGKERPDTGRDRIYEQYTKPSQFVPIGRSKGVGQLFGWWLPSWVVWILKGRTYMVGITHWYTAGDMVKKEDVWKYE